MKQYGTATVYGIDGTIQYDAETAIAAFPEAIEGEQRVQIEEFLDGYGELIGFRKFDEREYADVTIIPKKIAGTGSLDAAKAALAYPACPCKVTLASLPDSTATDIDHNGEYIYVGGARRTMVRGAAALRITVFKPKSSALTVDQLITEAV